jgi:hypothetical protein
MYVAFLDLLGFADAIESVNQKEMKKLPQNIQINIGHFRNELPTAVFNSFAFQQISRDLFLSYARYGVKSYLFTDSLFVISANPNIIIDYSRELLIKMYYNLIPIRGGIGYGTFQTSSIETNHSYADSSLISCPFFGSGVVRAFRAESCGLKGMRLLVHPSFTGLIEKRRPSDILKLPNNERSKNASAEINLLMPQLSYDEVPKAFYKYTEMLEKMKSRSNEAYHNHYTITQASLKRMLDHINSLL